MCKVSIISGAYNVEKTIHKSIESILNQTFTDWQFIICDDGSNDNTYNILTSYKEKYPKKFIIIKNEVNIGLNKTLNKCLKYATGDYIARHDLDDYSHNKRLEVQFNFLEKYPHIALVGTNMDYSDHLGVWGRSKVKKEPTNLDFIKGTPFCHATIMIRRSVLEDLNGYSEEDYALRVEDYELWFRLYSKGYVGRNLEEALYTMFDDREAFKRRKLKYRVNEAIVKYKGFKMLKIPAIYYFYTIRPILVGCLPYPIYKILHRKRLNNKY